MEPTSTNHAAGRTTPPESGHATLRIDLYSDYLCPWCWPAAVRLRELARDYPEAFGLRHKSFVLLADDQERVFTPYYLQHRRAAKQMSGLPYDLPEIGAPYPLSSLRALEAAQWVERNQAEYLDAYDLALFDAFFRDTRDISDPATLINIAESVGAKTDGMREALDRRELLAFVHDNYRQALARGVRGIPAALFIVVGSQGQEQVSEVVSGAVPYEEYLNALRRAESLANGSGVFAAAAGGEKRLPMA